MISWAHPSLNTKQHLDRFSCFCTDRRKSLYFTMGCPFSPLKLPIPVGDLNPHLMHGSLGLPESSTQAASRWVQPFLQGSLLRQTDTLTDHTTQLYIITNGQSNLTKRPYRRRTWTVQSYSPGGTNLHSHLVHASLDRPVSTS